MTYLKLLEHIMRIDDMAILALAGHIKGQSGRGYSEQSN